MKNSIKIALYNIMHPVKRDHKKTLIVAQYIIDKSKNYPRPAVTPMKLNKLVYIAQGYMLGHYGRPLLDEPIMAWEHGPFIAGLYQRIRGYRSQPVERLTQSNFEILTNLEKSVLNEVVNTYNDLTAMQLADATHKSDTPWFETWHRYEQNTPISNDAIEQFYKSIIEKESYSSL